MVQFQEYWKLMHEWPNCIFNCRVCLLWLLFWFAFVDWHGWVNTDSDGRVPAHKLKKWLICTIPWLILLRLIYMDGKYRLNHPWCAGRYPFHTMDIYPILQLNECQLILISDYFFIISYLYSGVYNPRIPLSRKYIFTRTAFNLLGELYAL